MLRELHIRNYAIVDEVSLQLSGGFNVITGETGAGKSILVGALSLILGERSLLEEIRHGSKEAILEAAFDPLTPSSSKGLPESDPSEYSVTEDPDLDILILKRVLSNTGKNRAYLNGSMSSVSNLKTLGQRLVEIHGQQGQHHLTRLDWQRTLLDAFGQLSILRSEYETSYREWSRLRNEQNILECQIAEMNQKVSMCSFQLSEIQDAKLDPEEEASLEKEEHTLRHWETVLSRAQMAYAQLSDEGGLLSQLDETGRTLHDLNAITKDATSEIALWEESKIQLKELGSLLRSRCQDEMDQPERLQEIESRLFQIHELKRKYKRSVSDLLIYRAELEEELAIHSENEFKLKELKHALEAAESSLRLKAEALSKGRNKSSKKLQSRVMTELEGLGMEKTVFQVTLHRTDPSPSGIDAVDYLIALPGEVPRGLDKIASGGELSRIMLALKVVLAEVDPVPTLLFDEIDAGVGGGIAERVGRRLFALSAQHQVLCITHLPQIASLADHHFFVEKKTLGDRVVTSIRELSYTERIEELARMLGGVTITDLTRRHAEEMICAR